MEGFEYATPACTGACANQDLTRLAASVAEAGPVSVYVNAGAWDSYTGGVLTSAACGGMAFDDLDHCVQLVGYNTTAAKPYWIVRNSWDTTWGEEGYIYLEYAKNTCGLGDEATIAKLKSVKYQKEEQKERFEKLRRMASATEEQEPESSTQIQV